MINVCKGDLMFKGVCTWNLIYASVCALQCKYCYMKRVKRKYCALTFREHFLKDDLGSGRTIFINASFEGFLPNIPIEWWKKIVARCEQFPNNRYLIVTKRPDVLKRMMDEGLKFPGTFILALTLESNRHYPDMYTDACPTPVERAAAFAQIPGKKMVVVDPAMDFDVDRFEAMIKRIGPSIVSYGTETGGSFTTKPPMHKSAEFLTKVSGFTKICLFKSFQKGFFKGGRNTNIKKLPGYRNNI